MKTAFLLLVSVLFLSANGLALTQERMQETAAAPPIRTNGLQANGPESPTGDPAAAAQKNYETALVLYDAGKPDEAIAALKEANKLSPDNPQFQYQLGMAYVQAKAYKDAAESFKRAARFKPDWPEAHFRFGMTSYVLGKRNQSLDAYKKLVSLNSPLANTLYRVINNDTQPNAAAEMAKPDNGAAKTRPDDGPPATTTSEPTTTPAKIPSVSTDTPSDSPNSSEPAPLPDDALIGIYRVGVGDILDIRFLNSSVNKSSLYTVIDGGMIDLPIAGGAVQVAGFTTDEIQQRIIAELKRRAVEDGAHVSVGVRQYSSHTVIITGLVNNLGTKILRREAVPLYVILAEAQPRPDAARAVIMRSGVTARVIDFSDSAALSTLIKPGDVINITAKPQEFYYIAGRVNYPGQKSYQPGITLLQAILAAGGVARGDANAVELSRESTGGLLTTTKVNLKDIKSGKTQDLKLRPGDRIEVVD
jgi:protein involved in polysaccharide export with SLBB domain/cytochrome c-type biogenesis protein CcmH/NrfG